MAHRIAGSYGTDAPYVPIISAVAGAAMLGYGLFAGGGAFAVVVAVLLLAQAALYMYVTKDGKFTVWRELIEGLNLRGDETALDVGCGRGLVLITLAQYLPSGRAVGLDLWRSKDQSGNSEEATMANAAANGVAERIELVTGDMSDLGQFPDDTFDVVTASVAIQNIKDAALRERTVREMLRVTKPGGQILIADIQYSQQYEEVLVAAGAKDVERHSLGLRMMYGNPFFLSRIVRATKP